MPVYGYIFLFFAVITGGSLAFIFRKLKEIYLKLLLSFSAAYLFALCIMHLIPDVYAHFRFLTGIFILGGFFIQILLEFFSQGIEHGHMHIHAHSQGHLPWGILVGLCIHSFLEAMPLAQQYDDPAVANSLLLGIILHHVPVSMALVALLIEAGVTIKKSVMVLVILAMMGPAGAATSQILTTNQWMEMSQYSDLIMALVIGIFLHISTTILFESTENHRFNLYKIIAFLTGTGFALLMTWKG